VTLRQDLGAAAGADAASLVTAGAAHVAVYNWTFLLSQSLMPGINAVLLGSLMYRSRLVPRIIPAIGLIGAPLCWCPVIKDSAMAGQTVLVTGGIGRATTAGLAALGARVGITGRDIAA
jgi:Domain of unknown function (DUF4386)